MSLPQLPFLLHAIVETLAALTFIFRPQSQLSPLPPAARLLVQSLGGLLLATNLICLVFLRRPFDDTSRAVCFALAFWHLWPCYRATVRICAGADIDVPGEPQGKTLGGRTVHLGVHVALLSMFLASGLLA